MSNVELYIEKELLKYAGKDVIVYYERGLLKLTWGFYVWSGHSHTPITLTELREDGFEKGDIKELRSEAVKFTVVEVTLNEFETKV